MTRIGFRWLNRKLIYLEVVVLFFLIFQSIMLFFLSQQNYLLITLIKTMSVIISSIWPFLI